MLTRDKYCDCYLRGVLAWKDPDAVVVLVDDVHVRLQFAEVGLGLHHVGRVAGLAVALLLQPTCPGAVRPANADARTTQALEVRLLRVFGRRCLDTATSINQSINQCGIGNARGSDCGCPLLMSGIFPGSVLLCKTRDASNTASKLFTREITNAVCH